MRSILMLLILTGLVGMTATGAQALNRNYHLPHNSVWIETRGTVEDVNTASSLITLKSYVTSAFDTYSFNEFYVRSEAEIVKEGQELSLNDLNSGDRVTIRYQVNEKGKNEIFFLKIDEG
ncbi:MAG: hypothetical protein AB7S78_01420 [Candidatus Omnitrophota bacterium]